MIRIGLLGASRIADKAIFQVLPLLNGFTVQAVAASNKAKALGDPVREKHGSELHR